MKRLTLILFAMLALVGLKANAAMYIVGDNPFGGWNPNGGVEMTLADGVYTYTATISGTVYFVFADGQDSNWTTFNSSYRYGPANGDQAVTAGNWVTAQKAGDHGAYKFTGTGGDYTFTFDEANLQFKVEGYVEPITVTSYTVAGSNATLFGTSWDPSNTDNDMTVNDGLYTWSKENVELNAGSFEFKVVVNHDWGEAYPSSNYYQAVEKHGYYNVTITFDADTKDIVCTLNLIQEIIDGGDDDATYTATGTENLFGSNWDPTDETNDMTLDAETGLYTWTKTGVVFEDVDTIEFKVVKNHSWDEASWPANNWWYEVTEAGTYDFVMTFNAETGDITFTATKQGEEPVEMVYTVVGPESIFGSNWDPTDETNDMTLNEGIYTWSKEEVTLYGNFEFKVVGNHDYAIYEWPIGMNNWVANVAEEGIYTIVITFDPTAEDADRITCTLTKTGDVAPIEHTYTVAGTENLFGSNWDQTDVTNDMVEGEDGIYTWTKEGVEFAAEEEVEFKVVMDHSWDTNWPSSNWYWKAEEAGTYNVVITFDPTADDMNKITFTATLVPTYLRGDVDMDGQIGIADVTALIDYILSKDATGVSVLAADCDEDGQIGIADVTALIDYILSKVW